MRRAFLLIFVVFAQLVNFGVRESAAITFQTIEYPSGIATEVSAITGGTVVGRWWDGTHVPGSNTEYAYHAFAYNGSTYTSFDFPEMYRTYATGISGSQIVGTYKDNTGGGNGANVSHGFTFDGSTWTTIDHPSGGVTRINGASGAIILGQYDSHGFIYDGALWTTIDFPPVPSFTSPRDMQGNTIVGEYYGKHGFVYDGSSFTTFDYPAAAETAVNGISGSNIVGSWRDSSGVFHGFVYDDSGFMNIDHPLGVIGTILTSIEGDMVAGYYLDSGSWPHGFIAIVPEPASIIMLTVGYAALVVLAIRRRLQPRSRVRVLV